MKNLLKKKKYVNLINSIRDSLTEAFLDLGVIF